MVVGNKIDKAGENFFCVSSAHNLQPQVMMFYARISFLRTMLIFTPEFWLETICTVIKSHFLIILNDSCSRKTDRWAEKTAWSSHEDTLLCLSSRAPKPKTAFNVRLKSLSKRYDSLTEAVNLARSSLPHFHTSVRCKVAQQYDLATMKRASFVLSLTLSLVDFQIIQTPGLWESTKSNKTISVDDDEQAGRAPTCAGWQCNAIWIITLHYPFTTLILLRLRQAI